MYALLGVVWLSFLSMVYLIRRTQVELSAGMDGASPSKSHPSLFGRADRSFRSEPVGRDAANYEQDARLFVSHTAIGFSPTFRSRISIPLQARTELERISELPGDLSESCGIEV
jgi:hypothetical protein